MRITVIGECMSELAPVNFLSMDSVVIQHRFTVFDKSGDQQVLQSLVSGN